jgi:hypothetical protein
LKKELKPDEGQNKKPRKTKMEILTELKKFMDNATTNQFYRSDIKELDPRTVDEYLRIIEFCQWNFPIIQILETDKMLVRILEQRNYVNTKDSLFTRSVSPEDAASIRKELHETLASRQFLSRDSLRKKKSHRSTDQSADLAWMKTPAARNLFQCSECEEIVRWPMHCLEVMTLKEDEEQLICQQCNVTVDIPKHCDKKMKIKIIKM